MDWKDLKGQQRKSWLTSSSFRRGNCNVLMKMSEIGTEKDKNPKIFHFSKVLSFFLFLTDFVNWNSKKGQQGKNTLSSMLRKGDKFSLSNENSLELTSEKKNFRKVSDFHYFCSIFVKI